MAAEHPGGVVWAIVERINATTERALHALDPDTIRGEDLLRRVLGSLPGMAVRCRTDVDRTIEFATLGCKSLTGFDPADLVGSRVVTYAQLIHPEDRARVLAAVRDSIRSAAPFEVTYRLRRVDGTDLRVREIGCPVRGLSGEVEAIEGLVTTVPHEAVSEPEPQVQAIVHDLNNVLGMIKTTAELVLLEARDPTVSADLTDIVSAATRASTLTRRLLHPGANPSPDPRPSE